MCGECGAVIFTGGQWGQRAMEIWRAWLPLGQCYDQQRKSCPSIAVEGQRHDFQPENTVLISWILLCNVWYAKMLCLRACEAILGKENAKYLWQSKNSEKWQRVHSSVGLVVLFFKKKKRVADIKGHFRMIWETYTTTIRNKEILICPLQFTFAIVQRLSPQPLKSSCLVSGRITCTWNFWMPVICSHKTGLWVPCGHTINCFILIQPSGKGSGSLCLFEIAL